MAAGDSDLARGDGLIAQAAIEGGSKKIDEKGASLQASHESRLLGGGKIAVRPWITHGSPLAGDSPPDTTGSLQRSPGPLVNGGGAGCPPQNPSHAPFGPSVLTTEGPYTLTVEPFATPLKLK